MTERGLPIVGGAPACPFVAFDDDRDERGTSPDHRHRCYAEGHPAPRALAHQEAYCLSSAFPVCPTFQDWARREAAKARPPDIPPAAADDEDEDGDLPPIVSDQPPRRGSRGTWSAPPPWLRGEPAVSGPSAAANQPPTSPDEAVGLAGAAAAGGLSGSFADRLASDREPPGVAAWDAEPPTRGLGPAERPVQPNQRQLQPPDRPMPPGRAAPVEDATDEDEGYASAPPPMRHRERLDAGDERGQGGQERDARDLSAPSWERPRRLEAYPTLRSRRLSAALVSPLLLGIAALVLAALALFFLPSLLGSLLGPGPATSPTPTTAPSVGPGGASAEPTVGPIATPVLYTVQPGDTFTKIANKFGINLTDLINANKDTHPNPDVLKAGDTLIIPAAIPSELPGAPASSTP